MYPLGHIGIALVLSSLFSLPATAFVLGALLPDIVDKGISFLDGVSCSRLYAHNVFFAVGAGLVALAVTRNWKLALAVFAGSALHLVEDSAHFVPYLYPVVQYDVECGPAKFQPGDFEVVMEIVGAALIFVWWKFRPKLIYLRERILKLGRNVGGKAGRRLRVKKA